MALECHIKLLSDTTFARGDGVAGLVDSEVEYEVQTGLPFIRGRTLKGLIVEECANLLYALRDHSAYEELADAAGFLFGRPGSNLHTQANLRVGHAELPPALRSTIRYYMENDKLTVTQVLESLTTIRRQTAVDTESGAPEAGSLRSIRAVVRQTQFITPLTVNGSLNNVSQGLLAACVMALRRGGSNRNRGSGKLSAWLVTDGQTVTQDYFDHFRNLLEVT